MDERIDINNLEDKELTCKTCFSTFIYEKGQQRFFITQGLYPPTHCPACIEERKRTVNKNY